LGKAVGALHLCYDFSPAEPYLRYKASAKPAEQAKALYGLESLIYSYIGSEQSEYAAKKILEYVDDKKIAPGTHSAEVVSCIVSPSKPDAIKPKDAELILRAAKETKGLAFKERFMKKVVDAVRMSLGMVSKETKTVATQVKKSFTERLRQERAAPNTQQSLTT
jgi:hypothetical protein